MKTGRDGETGYRLEWGEGDAGFYKYCKDRSDEQCASSQCSAGELLSFPKSFLSFLHSPSLDLDLLTLHNSAGASLAVVMGRLTTVAVGEKKSQFYFDNGQLRTTEGLFVSLPG